MVTKYPKKVLFVLPVINRYHYVKANKNILLACIC